MLKQNEITEKTNLLNTEGNIVNPGWARKSFYQYDRAMIKASKNRIKEWDYYAVLASDYGLALTIADNGYMGFYSVTLFDFINKTEISGSEMVAFTQGKLNLPQSSDKGDVEISTNKIQMSFKLTAPDNTGIRKRVLHLNYSSFNNNTGITADIELKENTLSDRMVIATPFDKNKHFYFNEKHNCLPATGKVVSGNTEFSFGENTWGVLDWGRGVWTYQNTWYWGSASGSVDDIPFGFNIGYGFGNTAAATENMLFYNGKAHKLDTITFHIPGEDDGKERYTDPWKFTSSDNRFEMDFVPILDRHSNTNALIIQSRQHQVFGLFTGKAVLDDGTIIYIKDFLGFAEKVYNRW